MRRIVFGIVALIGLALLIAGRLLTTQTDTFSNYDVAGYACYLVGLGLFVGGAQRFARPNAASGNIAVSVGRTVFSGIVRLVIVFVVLAVIIVVLLVVALNGSPTTKSAILDALYDCRTQSHTFSPASLGFSIAFPTLNDPVDQPDSSSGTTVHQYSIECGLDTYFLNYIDLPSGSVNSGNTDKILQGSVDSLDKAPNTLVSSANTMLQSTYPGKQFIITEPNDSILSKTRTVYTGRCTW